MNVKTSIDWAESHRNEKELKEKNEKKMQRKLIEDRLHAAPTSASDESKASVKKLGRAKSISGH